MHTTENPIKNPPEGWPRIAPPVFYDAAETAIDWLTRSFGFTVQMKVPNDQGQVRHSQLVMNGGLIMVGQAGLSPERPYLKSPQAVGGANTQALTVSHCERARAAGAPITAEPATQDYGDGYWTERTYQARDLEGHHWWFMQRLRGVNALTGARTSR